MSTTPQEVASVMWTNPVPVPTNEEYASGIARSLGVTTATVYALALRIYRTTTLTGDQWKEVFTTGIKLIARREAKNTPVAGIPATAPDTQPLSAPRRLEIDPGPV